MVELIQEWQNKFLWAERFPTGGGFSEYAPFSPP